MDVSENESISSKCLEKMAKHINEHDSEVKGMFTATSTLLILYEYAVGKSNYEVYGENMKFEQILLLTAKK
jgi:hypothetical protein